MECRIEKRQKRKQNLSERQTRFDWLIEPTFICLLMPVLTV